MRWEEGGINKKARTDAGKNREKIQTAKSTIFTVFAKSEQNFLVGIQKSTDGFLVPNKLLQLHRSGIAQRCISLLCRSLRPESKP